MRILPLPHTIKYNFETLFKYRNIENNKVLIYDKTTKKHKEKQIFRTYTCYLNTPKFNANIEKSYMHLHKENKLPDEFKPFLDFAKIIDEKYNEIVINYYEPNDYIEMHSDCTSSFLHKNSPILIINLNESNDLSKIRYLDFENRKTKEKDKLPLLPHSYTIINNNDTHRHGVLPGKERRISITFRQIKEINNEQ